MPILDRPRQWARSIRVRRGAAFVLIALLSGFVLQRQQGIIDGQKRDRLHNEYRSCVDQSKNRTAIIKIIGLATKPVDVPPGAATDQAERIATSNAARDAFRKEVEDELPPVKCTVPPHEHRLPDDPSVTAPSAPST